MWKILITIHVRELQKEYLLIAPAAFGILQDKRFPVDAGDQNIDASANFSGRYLTYSLSSGQSIASIDSATGILKISTNKAVPDTHIIVKASNSAGFAELSFNAAVDLTGVGHWAIGTTFMVS